MIEKINDLIHTYVPARLGVNKTNELVRLLYELCRRQGINPEEVLQETDIARILHHKGLSPLNTFNRLKKALLERRFPNAIKEKDFSPYLPRIYPIGKEQLIYNKAFQPDHIFIEESVADSPLAKRVHALFPAISATPIASQKEYRKQQNTHSGDLRKRDIFIVKQRWDFCKACPCTKGVIRCQYHIFNLGFGCPYDCSYCYLQQYTNSPGITLDANTDDFLNNMELYLGQYKQKTIRIGTGEFTDSLALDSLTRYAHILIPFFASKNVLFELKTKSAEVSGLLGLRHNEKTVISWSLNPQSIIEAEENGTVSLDERLQAARDCMHAGYKVGFHFDPIFYYAGWEKEYENVVNRLFDAIPRVAWISLGTFRFNRSLKGIIEHRFPHSPHIYGELVVGHDKKMRYYETLRVAMYKKMIQWIRKRDPRAPLYLCMESRDVWAQTLGDEKPFWFAE